MISMFGVQDWVVGVGAPMPAATSVTRLTTKALKAGSRPMATGQTGSFQRESWSIRGPANPWERTYWWIRVGVGVGGLGPATTVTPVTVVDGGASAAIDGPAIGKAQTHAQVMRPRRRVNRWRSVEPMARTLQARLHLRYGGEPADRHA